MRRGAALSLRTMAGHNVDSETAQAAAGVLLASSAELRASSAGLVFISTGRNQYQISLTTQPDDSVAVQLTDADRCLEDISPTTLVFTALTWDKPQLIEWKSLADERCTNPTVLHQLYSIDAAFDGVFVKTSLVVLHQEILQPSPWTTT